MFTPNPLLRSVFVAISSAVLASCTTSNTGTAATKSVVTKKSTFVSKRAKEDSSETTLKKSRVIGRDKHGMPTYSDSSRTRRVRATAYSHMEREKGAPGRKNAAGTRLKYGKIRSAAADWSRLPLGTRFKISGQPNVTYVVDDYGSALVGTNTVDIFKPTLRSMHKWGTRKITIRIVKMGDYKRSARLLKGRRSHKHCRRMYYAIQRKLGKSAVAKN